MVLKAWRIHSTLEGQLIDGLVSWRAGGFEGPWAVDWLVWLVVWLSGWRMIRGIWLARCLFGDKLVV